MTDHRWYTNNLKFKPEKNKIIIHNCLSCMHNCDDQTFLRCSNVCSYNYFILLKITCSRTKWQHNVNTSFTLLAILKSYLRTLPCKIPFRYFAITSCCLTLQWFSMDNISGYLKEKLQKKSHMNLIASKINANWDWSISVINTTTSLEKKANCRIDYQPLFGKGARVERTADLREQRKSDLSQ